MFTGVQLTPRSVDRYTPSEDDAKKLVEKKPDFWLSRTGGEKLSKEDGILRARKSISLRIDEIYEFRINDVNQIALGVIQVSSKNGQNRAENSQSNDIDNVS